MLQPINRFFLLLSGGLVLFIQLTAGLFSLFNKGALAWSEHLDANVAGERSRRWRILAWVSYLLSQPFWLIVYWRWHNWIAVAMNVSGLPSMTIGLFLAVRNAKTRPPTWLNGLALVFIPLGIGYSVHEFGGIRTWAQGFELGMLTAFLVGTYLVARQKLSGYGCYVLMHLCCTCLMFTHQSYLLCLQQIASLGLVVWAYQSRKRQLCMQT